MGNIIDDNLPLLFNIMVKFSNAVSRDFLNEPEKRYYTCDYDLFSEIDGRNGRKQELIKLLKDFEIIKKDKKGRLFYDVKYAYKLIKKSEFFQSHKV